MRHIIKRKRKNDSVRREIKEQILSVMEQMKNYDADSDEYKSMAENVETLMKSLSYGESERTRKAVYESAFITAGASVAEVFAFIFAEDFRDKILRGVAKNFILKLK